MNINITIFIQIANFFVGYQLLKYLLFKPALQYLQSEEKKKESMTKNISDQQGLLDSKIETKSVNWKQCQQYFSEHCPKSISKELHSLAQEETGPKCADVSQKEFPLSKQEITSITEHVEKALIERLQHVKN